MVVAWCGMGRAFAHHGEVLQGVFEDENFKQFRGLVTFPCTHLKTEAVFLPHTHDDLSVFPNDNRKALRAAALTLAQLGGVCCGHVAITSNIPVGRGLGSSTADVLATIHAVLDSFDVRWSVEQIMLLAVEAETACDSTLFSQNAVLFAQRDGVVLEAFDRPLPLIDIISIDCEPSTLISTLDFEPARYDVFEAEAFKSLRSMLRRAIHLADAKLVGRVATASARINQRFLAKPRLEQIEQIAFAEGAVGIQVAHSGTVVGMMFDHLAPDRESALERASDALKKHAFNFQVLAE